MITYLIKDSLSNLYKIGKTQNLKKRLSTLRTGNLNINLLYSIPLDIEKELHLLFKDKHVKLEWYDLKEEDVEGVKELFNYKLINNYVN